MKRILLTIAAFCAMAHAQLATCTGQWQNGTTGGTATLTNVAGKEGQYNVVGYGVFIQASCTTTGVSMAVTGNDTSGTDSYGFGIVDVAAASLVAHTTNGGITGTSFCTSTPCQQNFTWSGGSVTLTGGKYYMIVVGTTCASGCTTLQADVSWGQARPFIAANTSSNTPWTFSSSGFSGFSSGNMPSTTGGPVWGATAYASIFPPVLLLY